MSFIFLASPYSHSIESVREYRYRQAAKACRFLLERGVSVYSPIVHWHPVATFYGLRTDAGYYERMNDPFMEKAKELAVVCLSGWIESIGVQREIQQATTLNLPISYILLLPQGELSLSPVPPVER